MLWFSDVSEKCFKAHSKLPYRWEVRDGRQWVALPNNEEIEKDYCDPKKTYEYVLVLTPQ